MKVLFKSIAIALSLFFFSCQEDSINQVEPTSETFQDDKQPGKNHSQNWEYVAIKDIPGINSYLKEKTGKDVFSKKNSKDFGGAIFDTENILQVIDTLDYKNYSFSFYYPDTPKNIRYNLVIGESPNGEKSNPFVIKYTSLEGQYLNTFLENGSIFPYFNGTVAIHRYTDFFKNELFSKDCPPEHDQYGDPIPCVEEPVQSVGSGGSSSSAGGSGSSSSGGNSTSPSRSGSCIQYEQTCWCNGDLVGSHEHAPTIVIIDCSNPNYLKGTYRSTNCPGCETNSGSIGINFTSGAQRLKDLLPIPSSNTTILNRLQANESFARKVSSILYLDGNTPQAKTEAWMTLATELTDTRWSNTSGNYLGRPSLAYKASRTISINGQNISQYLLENEDVISYGSYRLCMGCSESENRTYYYSRSEKLWFEFKIPPNGTTDLDYLFDAFWTGAKFVGRYVLPIEDTVILINGVDFDRVEQSRIQTAGFMIVGAIPGGKVMKPVSKIISGITKYRKIVKVGQKSISLPGIKIINGTVDFGTASYNRSKLRQVLGLATGDGKHAHHIIPWEFRSSQLVQKAAKSDKVFHISEPLNGIALKSTSHLSGHTAYNLKIGESLNKINLVVGNDKNKAFEELNDFIGYLNNLIKSNPNKSLGEIANMINF